MVGSLFWTKTSSCKNDNCYYRVTKTNNQDEKLRHFHRHYHRLPKIPKVTPVFSFSNRDPPLRVFEKK